jgi:hypothetical protein
MAHNPQMRITDITAGKGSIAVLTKITTFLSFLGITTSWKKRKPAICKKISL